MQTSGNTILITGGATGIGLALAAAFLQKGNTVVVCGRRLSKLQEAKAAYPGLHIRQCDVSNATDRTALYDWTISQFPGLNMLINNAGIQREIDFRRGVEALNDGDSEIAINFEGVVHLTALFVPHLMKQPIAAVMQVSSGLAFVPMALAPVYCATKAALHSLSLTLRHQLKDTSVRVFEIIPPIVDTALDRGAREKRGQQQRGIAPEVVAEQTLKSMEADAFEIAVAQARFLRIGSRLAPRRFFGLINRITTNV
ncbi:MAG: SDR family NAD(P)-dependent oxidoreductase [Bacteroidetes bacterium]|nr:SDR family NAD(P)-dependent oxidoreductase [Fibrella sp.]